CCPRCPTANWSPGLPYPPTSRGPTEAVRTSLEHTMIEEVASEESLGRYAIDATWFDENNFSFEDFVQSRMCDSCQERRDEEIEERYTVLDKKTGRASFEIRRAKYGSSPIRVI